MAKKNPVVEFEVPAEAIADAQSLAEAFAEADTQVDLPPVKVEPEIVIEDVNEWETVNYRVVRRADGVYNVFDRHGLLLVVGVEEENIWKYQ